MTSSTTGTAIGGPAIPRPRTAEPDVVPGDAHDVPSVPELPAATYPWPEPWRSARGSRPRTEYWDVATAGWHSRGPKA